MMSDNTEKTTGEPMRCIRRPKGELEGLFPALLAHECACCDELLPTGVLTHYDDDSGGYVCSECGPQLMLAELMLLSPPPTLRDVAPMIRRPDPEEMEGLEAWDR